MLQILIKLSNYQKNDNIKMFPGQAARGGEGGGARSASPPQSVVPGREGEKGGCLKTLPLPCPWSRVSDDPPQLPSHLLSRATWIRRGRRGSVWPWHIVNSQVEEEL